MPPHAWLAFKRAAATFLAAAPTAAGARRCLQVGGPQRRPPRAAAHIRPCGSATRLVHAPLLPPPHTGRPLKPNAAAPRPPELAVLRHNPRQQGPPARKLRQRAPLASLELHFCHGQGSKNASAGSQRSLVRKKAAARGCGRHAVGNSILPAYAQKPLQGRLPMQLRCQHGPSRRGLDSSYGGGSLCCLPSGRAFAAPFSLPSLHPFPLPHSPPPARIPFMHPRRPIPQRRRARQRMRRRT